MKLVADESIEKSIVQELRTSGHTVEYIAEMEPSCPDEKVLNISNRKDAILLTADKDFGELVFRQRKATNGVILLRLAGISTKSRAEIVSEVVKHHGTELRNNFCVVTASDTRIRKQLHD